ncbi:hypothetical protein [Spongiactinospora sp. 9N601]|uniref:hypothetical protein n=1 Tax=Spongiactinospora sp. 9N601 TaxID=3375149 RepID=UPI0037B710F4
MTIHRTAAIFVTALSCAAFAALVPAQAASADTHWGGTSGDTTTVPADTHW